MKLYTNPRSRGVRVHWTLEELGVPYELKVVDMAKAEHKGEAYLKIHPLGQVPAFEDDDGRTMIESGAICVYLADKYPEKGLGPGNQPAEYFQWCFYCFGSLEPPLMEALMHTQWLPEEQRSTPAAERSQAALKKVLTHLDTHLHGREFMLGQRFSVADILIGGTLQWASQMLPMGDYPHLLAYIKRLNGRPAVQAVHAAAAV